METTKSETKYDAATTAIFEHVDQNRNTVYNPNPRSFRFDLGVAEYCVREEFELGAMYWIASVWIKADSLVEAQALLPDADDAIKYVMGTRGKDDFACNEVVLADLTEAREARDQHMAA